MMTTTLTWNDGADGLTSGAETETRYIQIGRVPFKQVFRGTVYNKETNTLEWAEDGQSISDLRTRIENYLSQ